MDEKTRYKLSEAKAQARLDELQTQNCLTCEAEIAAARALLETALQANNSSTALALMTVIGNLVKAERLQRIQSNDLLAKDTCLRLAREMGEAIADELRESGVFEWELICDRITDRIMASVTNAANRQSAHQ